MEEKSRMQISELLGKRKRENTFGLTKKSKSNFDISKTKKFGLDSASSESEDEDIMKVARDLQM